jgi:hypothetical protein
MARPITNDLVQRAVNFAWLFGIAIGLGIIFAVTRRLAQSRRGLTIGAVALMIVGIGMLVTGVLPLFALVLMLGGILILVEAFSRRSEATA